MRSPETGKFATAFVVSPPQSCSDSCTLMPGPFSVQVLCLKASARAPSRADRRARTRSRVCPAVPAPSSSSASEAGASAAERDQLAGDADRVVVGDQEARAGERPELCVRKQVKRLL